MLVGLISMMNLEYVSAEVAGDAPLKANRDKADLWQTFDMIELGGNLVCFWAAVNNKYISVVNDNSGFSHLAANELVGGIAQRETIFEKVQSERGWAFKSLANGKYVETNGKYVEENIGNLLAISDEAAQYESFQIVNLTPVTTLQKAAYLRWCGRGRPLHDDLADWFAVSAEGEPCLIQAEILFDTAQNPDTIDSVSFDHGINISINTAENNKDHDTSVDVYVEDASGRGLLAWTKGAANSEYDYTEFKAGSQNSLSLSVNKGIPKSYCDNLRVRVGATANGNDTWQFVGLVTLTFSDLSQITKRSLYLRELKCLGSEYAETDFDGPAIQS